MARLVRILKMAALRDEGRQLDAAALAPQLLAHGYRSAVRSNSGGGAGPSSFANLRHESVVVFPSCPHSWARGSAAAASCEEPLGTACACRLTEIIVEPQLTEHFAIPRPTPYYKKVRPWRCWFGLRPPSHSLHPEVLPTGFCG